jgi:hypothetical protein
MTHFRYGLIATVLFVAAHPSGWAAEPLDSVYAAGWKISEPAGPGTIQENGTGVQISWIGAVPVPYAVQTLKRAEVGIGLRLGNNTPVNGFTRRDAPRT